MRIGGPSTPRTCSLDWPAETFATSAAVSCLYPPTEAHAASSETHAARTAARTSVASNLIIGLSSVRGRSLSARRGSELAHHARDLRVVRLELGKPFSIAQRTRAIAGISLKKREREQHVAIVRL